MMQKDKSDLVRDTNDDALSSRLSAITTGYMDDEFTKVLASKLLKGPTATARKQPIINKGTYARSSGIDRMVRDFMNWNRKEDDKTRKCQIISLGAGSDSRYFQLKAAGLQPDLYVEIDYGQITSKKAMTICKNKKLKEMLHANVKIESGGQDLVSGDYWLISGDLYTFSTTIMDRLRGLGLVTSIPTLFLSECVLIYMTPEKGDELLAYTASHFPTSCFVTYEQILPHDAFGLTMIQNLKLRGLSLESIHANPTLDSQIQRYKSKGWHTSSAIDLYTYYKSHVDEEEKERIGKLEIFDEHEEWNLLTMHYCFVWASTTPDAPCFFQ